MHRGEEDDQVTAFLRTHGATQCPPAYAAESSARISDADLQALRSRAPAEQNPLTISSQQIRALALMAEKEADPAKREQLRAQAKEMGLKRNAALAQSRRTAAAARKRQVPAPRSNPEKSMKPSLHTVPIAPAQHDQAQKGGGSIRIESGIPIPAGAPASRELLYPFGQMRIGDSFLVLGGDPKIVAREIAKAKKRMQTKYCSRSVEGGMRVWRLA